MQSYLNQGKHFILNYSRWVVFRWDNFYKHTINKIPASDQGMKTMATVLYTSLQYLMKEEEKQL